MSLSKLGVAWTKGRASLKKLQEMSGNAQRLAKLSIFSMTRGEIVEGKKRLHESEQQLKEAKKIAQTSVRLSNDGSWRSAQEEYCEAVFTADITEGRALELVALCEDPEIQLGALSDAVGEAVRLAVAAATAHDVKRIDALLKQTTPVVKLLTSLDLVGNLRQKGDQARQHLRRLEDIRYDVSKR